MSWSAWESTLQFAVVYSIFALSIYGPLSAGVLSVASISCGAVGGFFFAWLAPASQGAALLGLILGGLAGGVFAFVISYAFLRLSSHYLAFATIALVLVTNVIVLNWNSITGGVNGKVAPAFLGWPYLIATLVVCSWVFARLRSSRIGLASSVIREDPLVGGGIGINARSVQRFAFSLGGVVGGLAGVLLTGLLQYVDPQTFYTPLAFTSLAAVVLGSAYHWQGAVIGGFVFTLLPYALRSYFPPSVDQVANGVVIILVVVFLPGGLFDARRWVTRAVDSLRSRSVPATAGGPAGLPPKHPTGPAAQISTATMDSDGEVELTTTVRRRPIPTGPSALEANGLVKVFGGVHAVNDLTLHIPQGSVFGILGPNGAGKTTLINLLSGVITPNSGTITTLGQSTTGWPSHKIARLGVARTYQNIRLSPGLSTLETIVSGAYARRRPGVFSSIAALPGERRERRQYLAEARELMATVGITTPGDRLAQTLSYGEQRRVEIARALASKPTVLLLDEPTAGMNSRESAALGDLLYQLVDDGLTVILVEHNIKLVSDYCDWAAVMQSGALLAEGEPAECLARDDVQTAYFGRRADAERIQSLRVVRSHSGD